MGQSFVPSMASLGLVLVLVLAVAVPTSGLNPRKLDDTSAPGSDKCSYCTQSPPPPPPSPPPPSPCPPPPALPPPPPPPSPKKPPSSYCPPPPPSPSSYIYITGPPGSLYPIDQSLSRAGRSFASGAPFLVGLGLMGLLALW
ncbi:sulfated surface glycoprotein 185 [Rhodamnia argentea]|uniref:Sulfated surface glycoprotein 185 n=1 Tax=Rhodamnia argentea TaxID=178133 RepID=A0A8B8MPA4_9MYRT|nr:sulfated surface glycoprotein 185 [Rhodamnia argentea]